MDRELVRHSDDENRWPRFVLGLSILAAGVIFALDRTGQLDAADYLRWWPLAMLVFAAAHLLHRRYAAAMVWFAFGVFWLLPLVGFRRAALWRVIGMWPLLIAAGGVTLILQALRGVDRSGGFRALAVMGGNVRRIGWQDFRGGEAVAVMGGCEVDLSTARIETEAVIDVLAFWGGIDIRIPAGWKVENRAALILGGYADRSSPSENGPRLVIRGSAIMGGMEVRTGEKRG